MVIGSPSGSFEPSSTDVLAPAAIHEESADTVTFLHRATGGLLRTVCVNAPRLPPELASPSYSAVIECEPMESELLANVAMPNAFKKPVPNTSAPSLKVTNPVGGIIPVLVTVAVKVTDCPPLEGLAEEVNMVEVLAKNLMSRIGWSSIPLGATPVWPWIKSKNPTPVICTGKLTDWKNVVAVRRASNSSRALATPGANGLPAPTQQGQGISVTIVLPDRS